MNEPFGSNQTGQQNQAPQQTNWAPQPVATQPTNAQPSSPFETMPIPDITGPSTAPAGQDYAPVMMESASPKSSVWLYVVLAIIVVGGLIFMASWMGWLNFGKLFGTSSQTTNQANNTVTTPTEPVVVVNKNDATRKTDLANIKTALQKYYNDKQSFPVSITLSKTSDTETPLKVLVPTYLPSLPIDPLSPNSFYGYKSDGKTFQLSAVLEDKSDSSGQLVGSLFLYIVSNTTSETPVTSNPVTTTTTTTTPTVQTTTTPVVNDLPLNSSATIDSSSSTSSSSSSTLGI